MKKKKLKKRIKKLEKKLGLVIRDFGEALNNERNRINTLGDRYTELRKDFNNLEQKLTSKADANKFQIDDIYEKLKILKLRTETDYTQFKPLVDTSKGPDMEDPNGQ